MSTPDIVIHTFPIHTQINQAKVVSDIRFMKRFWPHPFESLGIQNLPDSGVERHWHVFGDETTAPIHLRHRMAIWGKKSIRWEFVRLDLSDGELWVVTDYLVRVIDSGPEFESRQQAELITETALAVFDRSGQLP
jgi:hypothetical protein